MVAFHVLTTVFLIGPMAVLPMMALRSLRTGDGPALLRSARSTMIVAIGSLLVVMFGFAVQGMSPWDPKPTLGTSWILWSLIAYLVALAICLVAVVPALRSVGERLMEGATAAVRPNDYRRITIAAGLMSVLLVVVVVLMVVKP